MHSHGALRGVEVWCGQACLGLVFVASGVLENALSPATLWPGDPSLVLTGSGPRCVPPSHHTAPATSPAGGPL